MVNPSLSALDDSAGYRFLSISERYLNAVRLLSCSVLLLSVISAGGNRADAADSQLLMAFLASPPVQPDDALISISGQGRRYP